MVGNYSRENLKSSEGDRFFITGAAGFIGFHMAKLLLESGHIVCGYDCVSDYYDVKLKYKRINILKEFEGFHFEKRDLENFGELLPIITKFDPSFVLHFAAQAGVRNSIDDPRAYLNSNINGTFNILEAVRQCENIKHLLIASTSSVYGANEKMPFSETDKTDNQISFYAATKKSNEIMAHSHSHTYDIPTTMLRFFTVYGPWGRPDMALFKFTKAILEGKPIDVYNDGNMKRDFTYITDLVNMISMLLNRVPAQSDCLNDTKLNLNNVSPVAPFRIVNIGNSKPVELKNYIQAIEKATGRHAIKNLLPMQPGDVKATWSDDSLLQYLTEYEPKFNIETGVSLFVEWFRKYYKL
jgi:UDP-glucuronate 4-epimerase